MNQLVVFVVGAQNWGVKYEESSELRGLFLRDSGEKPGEPPGVRSGFRRACEPDFAPVARNSFSRDTLGNEELLKKWN
jgi:CheY-like chemotaxis protein